MRAIETEVSAGRILFAPRRSLALLGAAFGLGGAGAVISVPTHPRAATAMTGVLDDDESGCLVWRTDCNVREIKAPLDAILPLGRRRDPAE